MNNKEKTFSGTLKKITQKDNLVTLVFKVDKDLYGHTYTGPDYRNFDKWKNYIVGDVVDGLLWFNRKKKIIHGDSPVQEPKTNPQALLLC